MFYPLNYQPLPIQYHIYMMCIPFKLPIITNSISQLHDVYTLETTNHHQFNITYMYMYTTAVMDYMFNRKSSYRYIVFYSSVTL